MHEASPWSWVQTPSRAINVCVTQWSEWGSYEANFIPFIQCFHMKKIIVRLFFELWCELQLVSWGTTATLTTWLMKTQDRWYSILRALDQSIRDLNYQTKIIQEFVSNLDYFKFLLNEPGPMLYFHLFMASPHREVLLSLQVNYHPSFSQLETDNSDPRCWLH